MRSLGPAFKPGRLVRDPQGRVVEVKQTGEDASGPFVEVRLGGSYGATVRFPPSVLTPIDPANPDDGC